MKSFPPSFRIFFLFLLVLSNLHSSALALPSVKSDAVYQNLTEKWLVYDENMESYVPYLPNIHSQYSALHLIFDTKKNKIDYQNNYLGLVVAQGAKLFWNTRFSALMSEQEYIEISFDSLLHSHAQKNNNFNGFLMLTIYQEKPQNQIIEAYPAYILTQNNSFITEKIVSKKSIQSEQIPKPISPLTDWILVVNWSMLGIIVAFSVVVYPVVGKEMFNDSWNYFFRPAKAFKRTELLPQIGYVVYFSLVMGFVWIFYQYIHLYGIKTNSYFIIKTNLLSFILSWLAASFWSLCIAVFRLFWIQAMGKLFFKNNQLGEQHTQALIFGNTFTMGAILFTTVLFSFLTESPLLFNEPNSNLFLYYFVVVIVVSFLIQSLLTGYYLFTRTNTGKLYLFSYLCATEIIPLLILWKWIVSVV